jgi:hypothetical protein
MGRGVIIPVDDPDVVVLIDVNIHGLLHAPLVGQGFGPEWVNTVDGALLRRCSPNREPEEQYR